jgi:hypothetical protein
MRQNLFDSNIRSERFAQEVYGRFSEPELALPDRRCGGDEDHRNSTTAAVYSALKLQSGGFIALTKRAIELHP